MAARKTVPTVALCYRSDRANREDCPPPPYTCYFHFCIFYFVGIFCHVLPCFVMTWAIFLIFFVIFYVYKYWDSRYRKRNLLIGQPQGSLFERIDTQCAFVDLKITFSCGFPI